MTWLFHWMITSIIFMAGYMFGAFMSSGRRRDE